MTPQIVHSELTGKWYVVTRYKKDKDGWINATKKYDVTDQMGEILKKHAKTKTVTREVQPLPRSVDC